MSSEEIDYAQQVWVGAVDQAIQDVRLVLGEANNLYVILGDVERALGGIQYHQFSPATDADELIRVSKDLKHKVSVAVSVIQDEINRAIWQANELGDEGRSHMHSMSD